MTDIASIKASIKQTEDVRSAARKTISLELIKEIWSNYSEHNPSKSVQSALNLAILNLERKTISIKVPTIVSKEMILQESNLIDKLREDLGMTDLIFEIDVDKSLFPDFEDTKPVQLLTQKEKYMLMLEKKPESRIFYQKTRTKIRYRNIKNG
jgi:tRNA-binding EMAP/Myf-like protein